MTLRQFKYFIFSILLFTGSVYPQIIQSVSLSGNKVFSAGDYSTAISSYKSQKIFNGITDTVKIGVQKLLASKGYFNSTIQAELVKIKETNNYELKLSVDEGMPTYIGSILIAGAASSDSITAHSKFEYLKNSIFVLSLFEQAVDELLSYYENSGYPFAVIKISSVSFSTDSLKNSTANIYLSINRNRLCTIQNIEVEGNSKTKTGLIIRASGITLNAIYTQNKIEDVPRQLNRLRFFEPVAAPSFYFNSKDEGVLKIIVKEKETNSFDGIIGYVPSSQNNESGYFTGFVNIGLRNLFGTGRSALFRWQTESRETQELELKYSEPWLFNYPFNLDLSLFQRKQDTTYVQRNLEGRLEYMATENISAGIIISTQSTIPSENISNSLLHNSTSFETGISVRYDSRDDLLSPAKGIYFSNIYKFVKKTITQNKNQPLTGDDSFNLQKFEVDLSFYYSFFNRQVAALSLHARELRGSNFEIGDYYLFGGTNTLRGYREKQFQGNRLLWSNLEYRFLFSNRSFGFVFLDGGYFLRSADLANSIQEISEFKTGYGVGINLETGLGILSVSFALANGGSFKQGKIHFGIINEF
jgi:outer membrane protein insertion porin family